MKFDHTLRSIKKHISYELTKDNYTVEEVIHILKRVCGAIDYTMYEYIWDTEEH